MKTISLNKSECIACGACYSVAPDTFGCDDDGTCKLLNSTIEDTNKLAIEAVEGCPVGAISFSQADANNDKVCSACGCNPCECDPCECEDCECDHCHCEHE